MTALYSKGTGGNWSVSGTFNTAVDGTGSDQVPTAADAVTIQSGDTVTLDTTGLLAGSVTVNSGGTLTSQNSAAWGLTVGTVGNLTVNGTMTLDMSAATVSTVGTLTLNNVSIVKNNGGTVSLKGISKTRWTRLNGAVSAGGTSITVDDATGWATGDRIVLAATDGYYSPAHCDFCTGTNTVSGNTISSMTALTYAHADNCYVGNMSSNLIIKPTTAGQSVAIYLASNTSDNGKNQVVTNVQFDSLNYSGTYYGLHINSTGVSAVADISNNSFYDCRFHALFISYIVGIATRDSNIFYTANGVSGTYAVNLNNTTEPLYYDTNVGIFSYARGIYCGSVNYKLTGGFISGCINGYGFYAPSGSIREVNNVSIFANIIGLGTAEGQTNFNDCLFGTEFSAGNTTMYSPGSKYGAWTAIDCYAQTSGTILASLSTMVPSNKFIFINKNTDVTAQEIHQSYAVTKRDNSNVNRSTSSIAIYPTVISTDCQRTLSIPCANGSSVRVIGYVKKSHATNVIATVAITGLSSSVTPFTKANDTAWEQYDLSATNSSGNDGNFTLTYTANSSSGTTNVVYFDGVPDSPFVTKCRHYGFLFNESSPTREVDPYGYPTNTSAVDEATADGYTGVTINNTTKEISFAAGTADTAQKFYDYSRWWCCNTLTNDVPFTRAGTLYSLLSTWTVVDPYYSGSLTWSSGTVQYNSIGTKSDNLDGGIVEFNVAAGGTFTFDGTLSGTLDLRNLDDTAITVEVPTGTTTTTANNTGGTITVSEPQVYQSVVLTGGVAGTRVQVYDVTSSTELYNAVPGAWPYTWTDSVAYSADREIRLRAMYVSGATAKNFIDATIGTCTETSPSLPYLMAQTDDSVYNANAIDGGALTGYAIVGTNLTIDIDDGSASWPEMYAYQVSWLFTEDGIRDQDLYIEATDTANYIFYGGFQIKNTSSPTAPLLVTGGNGEPNTGLATDLLDTTGGTIFCNSAIVVPYSSGAEATVDIVQQGLTAQGYNSTRAALISTIPADVWNHTLP